MVEEVILNTTQSIRKKECTTNNALFSNNKEITQLICQLFFYIMGALHWGKSVRIWSYSGPYSVQMWENTNRNNSQYGHSLHRADPKWIMNNSNVTCKPSSRRR